MKASPYWLARYLCIAAGLQICTVDCADSAEIWRVDTGSDSPVVISITGELNPGDEKRFANIAVSPPDAIIAFDSLGGNLVAGIEIARQSA